MRMLHCFAVRARGSVVDDKVVGRIGESVSIEGDFIGWILGFMDTDCEVSVADVIGHSSKYKVVRGCFPILLVQT